MAPSDNLLVAAAQSAFLVFLDALDAAIQAGITVDCDMRALQQAVRTPGNLPPTPIFTFTKDN